MKTAVLTMAYKSYRFLEKWVDYYGGLFGRENLFVVSHGNDDKHREIGEGCNVLTVPRVFSEDFDVIRWGALSEISSGLTSFYDVVICGDCDELITTDPRCGLSLPEYLAQTDASLTVPLGLHLLPRTAQGESAFANWDLPLLRQSQFAIIDGAYCKPSILKQRRRFTAGGHEGVGELLPIDLNLVLFHLKYLDPERLELAHSLGQDVRQTAQQIADEGREIGAWPMSSVWRQGKAAEQEFLDRMQSASCIERSDPILFAYRFLMKNARTDEEGTRSYRIPMRNPRKIRVPRRFVTVF